jgi:hypothetical protein
LGLLAGCNRGTPPSVVTGAKSPAGWEVRYNATISLARRGSDHIKDDQVWEVLVEMLDEEQQLRNFRHQVKERGNVEVSDAGAAYLTLMTALEAVGELRRQRPDMELSGLAPAIEKLTRSSNAALSAQAKRTQDMLAVKN